MREIRPQKWLLILVVLVISLVSLTYSDPEPEPRRGKSREGKLFPLIQIVRFPNDPCIGATKNGTCYTSAECSARSGVSEGTCAEGYGVCCSFTRTCGSRTTENCTYFDSTGGETGSCALRVCKCAATVCQLRLDFDQFTISGPSTSTTSTVKIKFGDVSMSTGSGVSASQASQCATDTFSVSSPGNNAPPSICGINTGEHMYVDASNACNDLTFQLGNNGVGTGIANRQWSIKVTQLACDHPNLAPDGCTQYFFGADTNVIQSYNFAGGQHLANQDQAICIRRERGNCRICYSTIMDTDFAVSGSIISMALANPTCCNYMSGSGVHGDCVTIPGGRGTNALMSKSVIKESRFCGNNKGLVTSTLGAATTTICTSRQPFNFHFFTDNYELTVMEQIILQNKGFRLAYIQDSMNCMLP